MRVIVREVLKLLFREPCEREKVVKIYFRISTTPARHDNPASQPD